VQNGAETALASPTTNSAALTGLTAGTAYTFAVYAKDAAGNRSARSGTVTVTTSGGGTGTASCRVRYAVNEWSSGFTGNVTISNTSTSAVNGWTLRFAFPGGQQLTQGWEGTWSQSGNQVTAVNASWNGTINAGASVTVGFNAAYSGTNPSPTAFTLNNNACTIA
jgi:cellulase/cellobiase CelA1